MNPWKWLHRQAARLHQIQDTPHAIALGMAAGMFFGFVPLWGVKTLAAMGTAKLGRGSVVAAAVTVTLHDVLLPVAPLLLRWEYEIGLLATQFATRLSEAPPSP